MNAPAQVVQVEESFDDEVVEETTEELSSRDRITKEYAEKEAAKHEPETDLEPELEAEPEPESKEVEVIVNGFKKMVSKEKVDQAGGVEIYQKSLAANQGLQELAEQRQALKREQEEFEQYKSQQRLPSDGERSDNTQANNLPNDGDGNTGLPDDSDDTKELLKQYHEAILYGDDDDVANDLLDKIMTTRTQNAATQIDYDRIANQAAETARAQLKRDEWQSDVAQANTNFAEMFPDLAQDEELFNVTNNKTAELLKIHPDWSPSKIIEEAGNQVQGWVNSLAGQSNSPTRNEKIAHKKNTKAVKAATGRAKAKPEPKQQTNSEYILAERKRRGLE